MKVSEYIPFYGLLFNFEYQTGIEGKKMTVNEMFENYPDFELTETHLRQLHNFDLDSLQNILAKEYFTPETVVSYLRELFDDYRQSGGNPFDWLHNTFDSVNLNPQNYKAELRETLERILIGWIENFNKQPYDLLADLNSKNNIIDYIEKAVSLSEPERTEVFNTIIENLTDGTAKKNITLIKQRIDKAFFRITDFTNSEIEYCQSLFAKDFYTVLHSENYQTYIEDKIRELQFFCRGIEMDLSTKQYEFLEDREQDKNLLTEMERYKVYLENLLIHFNTPAPQKTKTETDQKTPTFTNNFDNINPTEIYEHFKAGLVEKGYLPEQELNEYLKAAFELKTIPETLFKLKHTPTKQKIYTVFYGYYKDIAQKKHERQKEYAALLGDYFEGYKTKIIQTNWARDYKTKR